jgi:nitrile hydratase
MTSVHDHHHHDGHGHSHGAPPSEIEARVRTLESLLVEKGLIDHSAVDAVVDTFENDLGPMVGARIVARAWTDPDLKARLLENAAPVIEELGHAGIEATHIVAVENTDTDHNVVVCTLCSCYPWALLGLPPRWYKAPDYRARIVSEPRKVIEDFGVTLGDDVRIHVWDSSADVRYLVIPQRPEGTEGMSEEQLAELVTRDSMIGVGLAQAPAAA